jgi:peptidoglycan/LPS O-acetylase OafA/YrhL
LTSPTRADGTLLALDGVRALAIVAVVAFHFAPGAVPGGWMGMSIFFPLSGFLVTRMLLRDREASGRVRLGRFWERRARRLLPALFVMLAVTSALVVVRDGWSADDTGAVLSAVFYVNNWWQLAQSIDYWAAFSGAASPFEHLWSLSVEEQFYLVWPPVIALMVWRARRPLRAVGLAALTIALAGAAWGLWLGAAGRSMTAIYYHTGVRAGELLAGAALAVAHHARPGWFRPSTLLQVAAGVVLAIDLGLWLRLDAGADDLVAHGGMFLVGLGTCVVIAASLTGGSVGEALSVPVVVWLGTRCYGLYLWHWPVAVFVDERSAGVDGLLLALLRVAITLAATVLSWWWVETPWRRRPDR